MTEHPHISPDTMRKLLILQRREIMKSGKHQSITKIIDKLLDGKCFQDLTKEAALVEAEKLIEYLEITYKARIENKTKVTAVIRWLIMGNYPVAAEILSSIPIRTPDKMTAIK